MTHLRRLEPADPSLPVLVPGDPEVIAMRRVDGEQKGAIKYTEDHIVSYRELAQALGVKPMQKFVF